MILHRNRSNQLSLGRQYPIFSDTYHLLQHEQYRFPPLKPSEATFESEDTPPEWKDAKQCFRCRQTFTTFTRKVKRAITIEANVIHLASLSSMWPNFL